MRLRDYQWEAVSRLAAAVARKERRLALVMPTGAGKSVTLACLLQKCKSYLRSATVVAPLRTIEEGFLGMRGDVTATPEPLPGTASSVRYRFNGFWFSAPNARLRADSDAFAAHLAAERPDRFAMVTTHAAIRRWRGRLPEDLTGRCLVLDEAHCADAEEENEIASVAHLWHTRGGTVLYVTATPFRDNGESVLPEGTFVHRRTIARHANDLGMAFKVERVGVDIAATNWKQVSGAELPDDHATLAEALVERWVADGCPKAVFIVPTSKSRTWSRQLAELVRVALPTARVHDAVGASISQQRALNALLERERRVHRYDDSEVDVILACRRFDMGTDWPLCSHVYNVGTPTNFGLVLQRWGRAFRDKGLVEGYPTEHAKRANITFIAPRASSEAALEFERKTHNMSMLLGVFLEDFETARQFLAAGRVARPAGKVPTLEEMDEEQEDEVPEEARLAAAEGLLRFRLTFERQEGRDPTTAEIAEHIATLDEPERSVWMRVHGELLVTRRERGARGPRSRLPGVNASLLEWYESVVAEYRDLTVAVFDESLRAYTQMTGETAEEVAKRLSRTDRGGTITIKEVRDAILAFARENGRPPTSNRDKNYRTKIGTFVALNAALRMGLRGLPGGSSLSRECQLLGLVPKREPQELPTLDQTRAWVATHKHGLPRHADRVTVGRWTGLLGGLNAFLTERHGTSLRALCDEVGVPYRNRTKVPLPEILSDECWKFFEATSRWPNPNDDAPDGRPFTWAAAQQALYYGMRGMPGGSSLARYCSELESLDPERAGRVRETCKTENTSRAIGRLRHAIAAHIREHGEQPQARHAGEFDGATWGAWDQALQHGYRGCPDGSSLARLSAEVIQNAAREADLDAFGEFDREVLQHVIEVGDFPTARTPGTVLGRSWNGWFQHLWYHGEKWSDRRKHILRRLFTALAQEAA